MTKKIIYITALLLFVCNAAMAQDTAQKKPPFSVSGNMGVSYEGYGLDLNPAGNYYTARRPWNLVRFTFAPTFNFGTWSLPVNFNFTPMQTNFVTPSTFGGFGSAVGAPQNFWQFITNPLNNFSVSPTYKWAQLQLGTQYLNYSDLSTGDIAMFGYGFALSPGKFRFKFFNGVSQRPVNYNAFSTPVVTGAYQRNNWMAQLGMEEEGKYSLSLNFTKGKDEISSVSPAPPAISGVLPQEGFTASIVIKTIIAKNYYFNTELAHSIYTFDETQPLTNIGAKDLQPFISARVGTKADDAAQVSFGHKSKDFDIGVSTKYIGAGFQTAGYPFMQPDRFDYTVNTRINTWKNKMNITASIGDRINNVSNTTLRSNQFIANINWFTQFSDHFNLNANYNNFGFQTTGINGVRDVANDLSINPTYNWTTKKMLNLITATYTLSSFKEFNITLNTTTKNNTQTALVTYVPTFFEKPLTLDFTLMYFNNKIPALSNSITLYSATINAGVPIAKKKVTLKGQLMYTYNELNGSSEGNNVVATGGYDWNISKKLKWGLTLSGNLFKYSATFIPPYARYIESTLKTSLMYRFK